MHTPYNTGLKDIIYTLRLQLTSTAYYFVLLFFLGGGGGISDILLSMIWFIAYS